MGKVKEKLGNIKNSIKNFNYKEYANTNRLFITFIIINLINAMLLRFFTVKNYFAIKPVMADLAIILLFGSFVYLFKAKKQFRYLMVITFIFTLICIINSLYYTYYMSFASFSLIAVSLTVVDVGDAVIQNVLQLKDFIFLWGLIAMFIVNHYLKKRKYYDIVGPKENRKKRFTGTLITGVAVYALFFMTVTSLEFSRLSKQWNREFLVTKFGVYTYQLNDLFKSLDAKFNTLFGYDKAAKEFREYYEKNQIVYKDNDYTGIFKGKNLLVIHGESIQNTALKQSFNGVEVTPTLNKLKNEGIYFSNFYAQASSGTSSDTEFSFSSSLLPVTNGSVAVSYWDRDYETMQKLLKGDGYNTLSFHANTGDFWNRNNLHRSLGYNTFYSKNSFEVNEENTMGLGLSDKEFFKQLTPILKKEYEEKGKFMATLIMLSNHTPFDELEKYGPFDVDIKEEVKTTDENGNEVVKTISHPYMEGTKLGNYFKSVHYADSALGELFDRLDKEGLLDNTVVLIYGDHDAKLPKGDFNKLNNYNKETDELYSEDDERYVDYDYYSYELDRAVPLIIWTKDKQFNVDKTTAMGMIDVLPTVSNMFGLKTKYSLGNDIMNLDNNVVPFPNGNWLTNDIYYNSQKDEYKVINPNAVIDSAEVDKNNELSTEKLQVSNDIILYNLIKNEDKNLKKSEGEKK